MDIGSGGHLTLSCVDHWGLRVGVKGGQFRLRVGSGGGRGGGSSGGGGGAGVVQHLTSGEEK